MATITQLVMQYKYALAKDALKGACDSATGLRWRQEIQRMMDEAEQNDYTLSEEIGEIEAIEIILQTYSSTPTIVLAMGLEANLERIKKIRANMNARLAGRPKVYNIDGDETNDDVVARFFA